MANRTEERFEVKDDAKLHAFPACPADHEDVYARKGRGVGRDVRSYIQDNGKGAIRIVLF